MPWFGKPGMGMQFNTNVGVELVIGKLLERGFLMKVGP
jgi:hypothetical protein